MFRSVLERDTATRPASIFDPISARLAERVGFEIGVLGSSIASNVVLGAPEISVITLPELAEQVRRISRASAMSFFVDADHGYGNALSVMRTIEDLEAAGAAGACIEDNNLPRPFGKAPEPLISLAEFESKLKAAVAARQDPGFVIIGRTDAREARGMEEVLRRVEACNRAGVDAIFLAGALRYTADDLHAVAGATRLPLVGSTMTTDPKLVAECRIRIGPWSHLPIRAATKALHAAYEHLHAGRPDAELRETATSRELDNFATADEEYKSLTETYLT
ncbi:MAG: isocitrate lyase/phosphoenolpyruvate mutase family protein [Vicinamibacterales bacterium]|nr:isocitrate lyase/phosphoenolpyruvate mutase family protein [Vicinamibacterales bacterium]